jgi:hypothetical protein
MGAEPSEILEKQARKKIRRLLEQMASIQEQEMLRFFHTMEDNSSRFQVSRSSTVLVL